MARATEIRKGQVIEMDGQLLLITDYEHKTPGNLRAIINIKTRNIETGQSGQMRLGSSDQLEVAFLDRKKAEYLYKEANGDFMFMDSETYEQFVLTSELVGDKMGYVKENETVDVTYHNERPLGIELPAAVVLTVTESEEAVKGNTATNVKKSAIVETGLEVKVPFHIKVDDRIKISTDTGDFLSRVND
ncbi:Elongation factor P [Planctomycetes bacterium Pla163]|uniref:Elongation factor P n=1 Tax=Rohdeia mirabilis TaxID=2528008 RepID=A0A518D0D8_9BACT|nr:Elongation factor P [Planctomycetes bacterium Pla163]